MGVSAQTLPIIVGYGAHLITTPFVLNRLGLTNFGIWALTGAVAQYAALLDLGVSRAITRFVALYHAQADHRREKAVVGGSVAVIAVLGFILLSIALAMPTPLGKVVGVGNADLSRILFSCSVVVFITGVLASMFRGASIGRGRMVAGNIGLAFQRASVAVGGVIGLMISPALGHFAIGSAIGGVFGFLGTLLAIFADEREIRIGMPKLSVMSDVISFGLKGQAAALAEIVLLQYPKLLAGIIVSPAAAGVYELGSRLALGARAIGTSTSSVITAHLSRSFSIGGHPGVRQDYARLAQRNAVACIFPLYFFTATSFSVVPAWLNSSSSGVVLVLIALSVIFAVSGATGIAIAATYALDKLGVVVATAAFGSILAVILSLPLAHFAGLAGIVAGLGLSTLLSSVAGVIAIHLVVGIPLREFFSPVAGPFAVGAVSVTASLPIGLYVQPSDRGSSLLPLVVSATIYVALFLGLSWRLGYLPDFRILKGRRP